MVTVTCYTGQGFGGRRINLDISKSVLNGRLRKAMEGPNRDGWGPNDMLRVDSGALSLSRLMLLFTPDEIRAGLDRALVKSSQAEELRADIDSLLTEWTLAQGGEPAQAGAPKPGAKPAKDKPPGAMAKGAGDILKAANDAWKRSGRP